LKSSAPNTLSTADGCADIKEVFLWRKLLSTLFPYEVLLITAN
jgi:hypothetical protein